MERGLINEDNSGRIFPLSLNDFHIVKKNIGKKNFVIMLMVDKRARGIAAYIDQTAYFKKSRNSQNGIFSKHCCFQTEIFVNL